MTCAPQESVAAGFDKDDQLKTHTSVRTSPGTNIRLLRGTVIDLALLNPLHQVTRTLTPAAPPTLHKLQAVFDLLNADVPCMDHRAIPGGVGVSRYPLLASIRWIRGLQVEEVLGAAPEVLEVQVGQIGHGLEVLQDRLPGPTAHVDLSQVDVRQARMAAQEEQQGTRRGPDASEGEAPQLGEAHGLGDVAEQGAIGPGGALHGIVQVEVQGLEVWCPLEEISDPGEVLLGPGPGLARRYPDGSEMLHGTVVSEDDVACRWDESYG